MIRLIVALTIAIGVALGTAAPSMAQDAKATDGLRRQLESRMQGLKIKAITKTNYSGLLEVRTDDDDLFYTDEKGTFVFVGAIRDGVNPQRNLTEERIQQLTMIKWKELPLNQAFKMVRGKGSRQLAYFSDPNCPYCRQFERELAQLDDVTIHVFLYPILAADSMAKSRAVWCAPDKAKAWTDLMLSGIPTPPAAEQCTSPLEQVVSFGKKIRVQSVPTLVLSNGTRIAGVRTAAQLSKLIDDAARS